MATETTLKPVTVLKSRRFRLNSSAILLSLPAFLVVVALFIYPFLYGVILSFRGGYVGEGGWTLDNYRNFFGDSYLAGTIGITFNVALPVTLVSVGVSIPLAYYMRRGIKFERFTTALLILPITLGTVMVSQGMITYFSPTGWFNTTLLTLGIIHDPLTLLRNVLAVQISLLIQGFPFTFLLILGYMSAINPDLERASRMLGASAWTTFRRVVFPLSLPGIAIAFCLNFVANFSVFPSANLVGEPTHATHVIAVEAYNQAFNNFREPFGTAIALVMGAIELLVIALVLWLQSRTAGSAAISGGKERNVMAEQIGAVQDTKSSLPSLSESPSDRQFREKPLLWFLKGRFWAGVCFYIAIGFFVVNILGLVGTVVVDSFGARWFGGTWLPQGFTTQWYQLELNDHDIGSLLFNTLFVAGTVTLIALAAGFGAAYVLARMQFRFKWLLIVLYLLPMLLPPLVYGIPLATVLLKYLGGALPSVILINLVPVLPFVILILRPFVEQIDVSLESASRMLGANRIQTFWRVLLPLMLPGLLTAGILAMVRTIAMFELTFLVADANSQTLVVILYSDAFAAGIRPNQEVDAMAVIYTLTTMAMVIVALIFVKPTQFVVRLKKT